MTPFWTSALLWLAQVTGAASVLILLVLALGRCTHQPARRQRVYEFGLAAALLTAVLSLAPSWLVIGLPLSARESPPELLAATMPENQDLWVELVHVDDPTDVVVPVEKETGATDSGTDLTRAGAPPWGLLIGGSVLAIYLLGVAYFLTRWAAGQLCLRRLIRRTEPVPAEVDDLFQTVNGQRSWPRLLLSRLLRVPISCGLWRPKVVLPAELCEPGQRPKLPWVFAHELTHVERRDAWSTLLLTVCQALFFHMPWYWWLKRRVRLCQEYVADAAAVADRAAADYAEFLLSLTQTKALPLGATGVTGQVSDLYRRVTMLLQNPLRVEKRCPRWWSWALAGGLLSMAVLIGGIGLQAAAGDTIVIVIPGQKTKDAPASKELPKITALSHQGDVLILRLDEKGNVVPQTGTSEKKQPHVNLELTLPQAIRKDLLQVVTPHEAPRSVTLTHPQEIRVVTTPPGQPQVIFDSLPTRSPSTGARVEWIRNVVAKDQDELRKILSQLEALIKDVEKEGAKAEKLREAVERLKKELPKAEPSKRGAPAAQALPALIERQFTVPNTATIPAASALASQIHQYSQFYQPGSVDLKKLEKLLDKLQADPSKVDPKEIKQALEELRRGGQTLNWPRFHVTPHDGAWQVDPNTYWAYATRDSGRGRFGIHLVAPSADLAEHLGLPKHQGIVVEQVYADTPAAKAGLKARDIILKLKDTPLPRDQQKATKIFEDVKDGDSVDLTILRKGKEEMIKGLKPAPRQDTPAAARLWTVRPYGVLGLAEPIPEKGAVVTLRRDGDKFSAKHQEKNTTITIEGTVKDGKVSPTEIVIQEAGKSVLKSRTTAELPDQFRARVERLLGLSAFEPANRK